MKNVEIELKKSIRAAFAARRKFPRASAAGVRSERILLRDKAVAKSISSSVYQEEERRHVCIVAGYVNDTPTSEIQ